jgi:hypothetical protein
MDERVTTRPIKFAQPFSLKGIDGELAAGSYAIETIEEPIDGLSFLAYRRVSTAIVLTTNGGGSRQIVTIDAQDLEAAIAQDVAAVASSKQTVLRQRRGIHMKYVELSSPFFWLSPSQPLRCTAPSRKSTCRGRAEQPDGGLTTCRAADPSLAVTGRRTPVDDARAGVSGCAARGRGDQH